MLAETPEMEEAAFHLDGLQNRLFLDLLAGAGVHAPRIFAQDLGAVQVRHGAVVAQDAEGERLVERRVGHGEGAAEVGGDPLRVRVGPEADDAATSSSSTSSSSNSATVPADAVGGLAGPRGSQPPTFYGAFKKAVELIARQYWLHYGVASVEFLKWIERRMAPWRFQNVEEE